MSGPLPPDTDTGLEWLDLTQTKGRSRDSLRLDPTGNTYHNPLYWGWRYATSAEVCGLIEPRTGPLRGCSGGPLDFGRDAYVGISEIQEFLGVTDTNGGTPVTNGMFATGRALMVTARDGFASAGVINDPDDASIYDPSYGHFLVRVPEPHALLLLIVALGAVMRAARIKPLILATLALVLSVAPSVALADLILVEDNRFIEWNRDGDVTRVEPPEDPSWEWAAQHLPGQGPAPGPTTSQRATFSGTRLHASGGTFLTLDGGIVQEAHSTFDVLFRVDRPTFISLGGQFSEAFSAGFTGQLVFMENSTVLLDELSLTEPDPPYTMPLSFALSTTLVPEATYRLVLEASVRENSITGATDEYQNWSFTLEVPELPAVALLPLVLVTAGVSRRGTKAVRAAR